MEMRRPEPRLTTAQIGRCGEILVQYRLLNQGIESAAMTTDAGVDLVAFGPQRRAVSIQVKTNLKPKPAGGKGRPAYDWWIPENSPAELVALVDLEHERVWLLKHRELELMAQQRSGGRLHFYAYADALCGPGDAPNGRDLNRYRIERRIGELFGSTSPPW
jgi:hypothetical protein